MTENLCPLKKTPIKFREPNYVEATGRTTINLRVQIGYSPDSRRSWPELV